MRCRMGHRAAAAVNVFALWAMAGWRELALPWRQSARWRHIRRHPWRRKAGAAARVLPLRRRHPRRPLLGLRPRAHPANDPRRCGRALSGAGAGTGDGVDGGGGGERPRTPPCPWTVEIGGRADARRLPSRTDAAFAARGAAWAAGVADVVVDLVRAADDARYAARLGDLLPPYLAEVARAACAPPATAGDGGAGAGDGSGAAAAGASVRHRTALVPAVGDADAGPFGTDAAAVSLRASLEGIWAATDATAVADGGRLGH